MVVRRVYILDRLEPGLEVGLLLRAARENQEQATGRHGDGGRALVVLGARERMRVAVEGDQRRLVNATGHARSQVRTRQILSFGGDGDEQRASQKENRRRNERRTPIERTHDATLPGIQSQSTAQASRQKARGTKTRKDCIRRKSRLAGWTYAPAGARMDSRAAVRSLARACWASSVSLAPWLVR